MCMAPITTSLCTSPAYYGPILLLGMLVFETPISIEGGALTQKTLSNLPNRVNQGNGEGAGINTFIILIAYKGSRTDELDCIQLVDIFYHLLHSSSL